ncbi:MAG: glycine/sarcosine/betaine reductase selenoprotein B family protein [Chloroflexota bacterium]
MSQESFNDFKNSFSYGSRTDLSFKFLKGLSEEEGATFFQDLIKKIGLSIDDGDLSRLVDHVVDGQILAYSKPTTWTYDDGPFTPLTKAVNKMNIGLLTSTGHFVKGEDPNPLGVEQMTQQEATERISDFLKDAPALSEIPLDIDSDALCVRHGGYDIRGVEADRNVALPLDQLRALEKDGAIGSASSPAYSFVGAAAQRRLLKECIPGWIERIKGAKIEGMLLVPV